MKLTYKFNNDEKRIDIERLEYLDPEEILHYNREGDKIYVSSGDYVYINQLLKESTNGMKSYATVSGTVEIESGIIKIINDHSESTLISEDTVSDLSVLKKDAIISACESLGIEYENKLIVDKLKNKSKLLIINAMDIEPYQFNNNYLFEDRVDELLQTMEAISNIFNLNVYLLLNKFDDNNIDAVRRKIGNYPNIIFKVINEVFPYTTNQCIAHKYFKEYKYHDIIFLDSFALNKISVALKDGLPVSDRYITVVVGDASRVCVIKCRYGTNIKKILEDSAKIDLIGKDIYLNNFMRRLKCENIDSLVVTDNIKTIFIRDHEEVLSSKCIKCGKCVDICPVNINPLAKKLDPSCIRCGLCNYVCPANINLLNKER